jgi:omega-amidase
MPDLKVSIVQYDIAWQNPAKNLKKIDSLLLSIDRTDLIVLPEMFTTGFTMDVSANSEKMDGPTIDWMRKVAERKGASITGSLIIQTENGTHNRLVWVRPDGTISHYDKRHLFRMAGEDEQFTEGREKIYPIIKGWRICPLICYDLRFPVWSRNQNDYDALIYVANWPALRNTAWETLCKARAIENLSPVIAVNRVGRDGKGVDYVGNSAVYDATGEEVVGFETATEGVRTATLKYTELKSFRTKFPTYLDADDFAIQG